MAVICSSDKTQSLGLIVAMSICLIGNLRVDGFPEGLYHPFSLPVKQSDPDKWGWTDFSHRGYNGYFRFSLGSRLAVFVLAVPVRLSKQLCPYEIFEKMGFHLVDKDTFPRKLAWECLECPRLEKCDELAYLINVD